MWNKKIKIGDIYKEIDSNKEVGDKERGEKERGRVRMCDRETESV